MVCDDGICTLRRRSIADRWRDASQPGAVEVTAMPEQPVTLHRPIREQSGDMAAVYRALSDSE